jgi:Ni,Fe-hydrogenase I large subunit
LYTLPQAEHVTILRTLSQCPPGKGLVVGDVGPVASFAFRTCEAYGWVEAVRFDTIVVWKVTPDGRYMYQMAIAHKLAASVEG